MSITIVTQPDNICLVRQPAVLAVTTNNYVTTAGTYSVSYLELTGDPTNGQTFTVVCNGYTMICKCRTSPVDPGEFAVNSGLALDDYAQEIINYIKQYNLLDELVNITLDGASNPALGKIKFTARRKGPTYNITLTESLSNATQSGYSAGVAEVVRSGMKITCEVYAEDIAGTSIFDLAGSTESDLSEDSGAVFYLNRILHDFCKTRYYLPSVSLSGKDATGLVKSYYYVLNEKYGTPPALYNTLNDTHTRKSYVLGGLNYGNAITNAFTADYITDANGKKFLTKRPRKRYTRTVQQELLYCYIPAGLTNFKVSVTAWDTDNVSMGAAVVHATYFVGAAADIYCFAVGYTELGIESLFGAPVFRYKVKITFNNAATSTEEVEYIVDRSHYYTNETLYYVNGFGCTETLWVRGTIIEKPVLDRQQAERLRKYNDLVSVGEYHDANPTHRKELEINVGYLCTYLDSEWVADVLNTTNLWWYRNSQMLPLQILDKNAPAFTTKQNVRELTIHCIEAFDNNTI